MKYHVAISGSYGGMNLGDEAILEGILKELNSSLDVDVVVFSRYAKDTEARHKVRALQIHDMPKEPVIEELKKVDLLILGGGGILFNELAEIFLREVTWAIELNIPVMIYAISVGPLENPDTKKVVAEVLNKVDIITVRETISKKILHDLGVTIEIEVTADPAFLIEEAPFTSEMLKKEGIDPKIPLVGFSIREPGPAAPHLNMELYHNVLANTADFIIERFEAQVVFIPMERGTQHDPQYSHAIISKMLNALKTTVIKGEYTSSQLLGLTKHLSFAVGMRLHFLMFAALNHVPFVPLSYADKVRGLLEDLDMPLLSMTEWNAGKICAVVDRAWDNKSGIIKKFEEKVPLLKERSKKTNQILVQFLKTLSPKNR